MYMHHPTPEKATAKSEPRVFQELRLEMQVVEAGGLLSIGGLLPVDSNELEYGCPLKGLAG